MRGRVKGSGLQCMGYEKNDICIRVNAREEEEQETGVASGWTVSRTGYAATNKIEMGKLNCL